MGGMNAVSGSLLQPGPVLVAARRVNQGNNVQMGVSLSSAQLNKKKRARQEQKSERLCFGMLKEGQRAATLALQQCVLEE